MTDGQVVRYRVSLVSRNEVYLLPGHILRKVYNSRERKNISDLQTTAQPTSFNRTVHTFLHFLLHFSTLFHCSCSKFTTATAQFPFYNCKFHFTTAQIVISCTLKYALPPTIFWV